jgi:hypothetical protein
MAAAAATTATVASATVTVNTTTTDTAVTAACYYFVWSLLGRLLIISCHKQTILYKVFSAQPVFTPPLLIRPESRITGIKYAPRVGLNRGNMVFYRKSNFASLSIYCMCTISN